MTAPLPNLREQAATRFEELGWPSARSESWRYFKVRDLREGGFEPSTGGAAPESLPAPLASPQRVLVVDGRLATDAASYGDVTVTTLGDAHERHFSGIGEHLDDASMVALNTQHFAQGVAIVAPKNAVTQEAIELLLVNTGGSKQLASPRVYVFAERHAQVDLVLRYVSAGDADAKALTNAVLHVVAQDGARVRTATVCDEGPNTTHVHTALAELGRDAHYGSHVIMRGGKANRSEIRVKLQQPGANCDLKGVYLATGKQVHDNYTQIEHIAPHTSSNELYRGIIEDNATGTFQGRVLIGHEARNSEAHQLNNNLLLGEGAVANTKPQLEIDIDEVVASHGSTVGSLDANALFYLTSRGIPRDRARGMLTYAFANEVLEAMASEPLATLLDHELEEHLSGTTYHASWPEDL